MKVALICLQLGVPRTLATTAFVTAFADGLAGVGVKNRIVGLVHWERSWGDGWQTQWDDAPLRPLQTATPWIRPPRPTLRDATEAGALGILDKRDDGVAAPASPDWYLELLLQRELESFADDDDLALVVYPISLPVVSTVARIARRRGWRLIVQSCETMSGSWIDSKSRQAYVQSAATNADGVWVLSDFLAEYWQRQGVSPQRILVQPNVVRRSAFGAAMPPPRTRCATYLGNLEHAEIAYLLDIAATVMRRVPEFRLTVYADATDERRLEFEEGVAARGLARVVLFEAPVPPSEVPQALSRSDVLVLPRSRGEFSAAGFPNKLGEYLASGRPVVVTRVGDIPKYLVDGESAFLVEPDSPEAFAEALVLALTDGELADRVGANGARVAEELLASPVAARRIIDFIGTLPSRSPEPLSTRHGERREGLSGAQLVRMARGNCSRTLQSLRHRAGALYRGLQGRTPE